MRRFAILMIAVLAMASTAVAQDQPCAPCLDVSPPPAGDGASGIGDVVRILRFAAAIDVPTAEELRRADVAPNVRDAWAESVGEVPVPILAVGSGRVEVADVVAALRVVVGLDTFVPLPEPELLEGRPDETCLGGLFSARGRGLIVGTHVAPITLGGRSTELVHARRGVPMGPLDLITVRETSDQDPETWLTSLVDAVATTRDGLELTLPDATTLKPRCETAPEIDAYGQGHAYAGGQQRISGRGLACVEELRFEDPISGLARAATVFEVRSDEQMWVLVPEWPGDEIVELNVIATNACGEAMGPPGFVHLGDPRTAVPDVIEIAPAEGPSAGGNQVRITGRHLGLVDSIAIGTEVLDHFGFFLESWDVLVVPTMPASATDPLVTQVVDVLVAGSGREDPTPLEYTYLGAPHPACGEFSPSGGALIGGESVIVTAALGAELDVIDEVRFGGVPATGLVHPNSSQLALTTPTHPVAEDVAVELLRDGEVMSTCPAVYSYR